MIFDNYISKTTREVKETLDEKIKEIDEKLYSSPGYNNEKTLGIGIYIHENDNQKLICSIERRANDLVIKDYNPKNMNKYCFQINNIDSIDDEISVEIIKDLIKIIYKTVM